MVIMLTIASLAEGGIHRYTRPHFEAWLQGRINGYDVDFNADSYDTTFTGFGFGAGASLNLVSLFTGFQNSSFPNRINIFATASIEKLPTRTMEGTSYQDIVFGSWRREIEASVSYTPLNINLGPDVKINLLPFFDISGSFAFTLQNDICVYDRVEDEYRISDGTRSGHSTNSETYTNKGFGFQLGYGAELYPPAFPFLKLGFQMRHSFLKRPFFSDENWETSHFDNVTVYNRAIQPSFFVTYSLQRVNKVWIAQRTATRDLKKYLNTPRNIGTMNSAQLYSQMLNLDKLHSTLQEPVPKLTLEYAQLKAQIYERWIGLVYEDVVEGASSYSAAELAEIQNHIETVCCEGVAATQEKTSQLKIHIDQELQKMATREQQYRDSISAARERENDSIAASNAYASRLTGKKYHANGDYSRAINAYRDFLAKYGTLSLNQQDLVDTIGTGIDIAKTEYAMGEYYLRLGRSADNIVNAQKWYMAALEKGYQPAAQGLRKCRVDSKPTSIKFKGFFVGISSTDAIELIEDRYLSVFGTPKLSAYSGDEAGAKYVIETEGGAKFLFDNSLRLLKLYWPEAVVNALFNVGDFSAEQFAQEFVNSYGIPRMDVDSDITSVGIAAAAMQYWEYISNDGVRLRIYGPGQGSVFGFPFTSNGKDIRLERVPTKAKRSFD